MANEDGTSIRHWIAPSFVALLFGMHLVVAALVPHLAVMDPGTGWHLATGRLILESGALPAHDPFSYTASGHEWTTYEWLFQVLMAYVERVGGLPLVVAMCGLVYAALPPMLYLRMRGMGASMGPALAMAVGAYCVLLMHALARPHVFTYVFFLGLLWGLDLHRLGRLSYRALWWGVPLMVLWANLHGGFVVGLVLVGLYAAVPAARWALWRGAEDRGEAWRYGGLFVAMSVATLLNPHGWGLHWNIKHFLGLKILSQWMEFRSPDFYAGTLETVLFEAMILALLAVLALGRTRLAAVEVVLLLFFLHYGLRSVRHVNLFVLVAAPILARELTPLLAAHGGAVRAWFERLDAEQKPLRSTPLYVGLFAAGFAWLALVPWTPLRKDLLDIHLSRATVAYIDAHPERFGRMFNTVGIGGALIERYHPRIKVYMDDRADLYRDEFTMTKYFTVLYGATNWAAVLDEYGVTSAVVDVGPPVGALLEAKGGWRRVHQDEHNAIYLKESQWPGGVPGASSDAGSSPGAAAPDAANAQ